MTASCHTGKIALDVLSDAFEQEEIRVYQDRGIRDVHLSVDCSGDGIGFSGAGINLTQVEAKEIGTALIDAADAASDD